VQHHVDHVEAMRRAVHDEVTLRLQHPGAQHAVPALELGRAVEVVDVPDEVADADGEQESLGLVGVARGEPALRVPGTAPRWSRCPRPGPGAPAVARPPGTSTP
jgi:hypothetical protein